MSALCPILVLALTTVIAVARCVSAFSVAPRVCLCYHTRSSHCRCYHCRCRRRRCCCCCTKHRRLGTSTSIRTSVAPSRCIGSRNSGSTKSDGVCSILLMWQEMVIMMATHDSAIVDHTDARHVLNFEDEDNLRAARCERQTLRYASYELHCTWCLLS